MIRIQDSSQRKRKLISSRSIWPLMVGLILLHAGSVSAAQAAGGRIEMKSFSAGEIFIFLFLMLGPIKIIGPFARATRGADVRLANHIAFRAIAFSSFALFLAAVLGESFLLRYNIPLPVLVLAAGVVLFLVALQNILRQFTLPPRSQGEAAAPTLSIATTPIAFPTIVTPYGIAALIVFIAVSPDWEGRLVIAVILLAIMLLNLLAMLLARHILRFLGVFLQIVGAVLGIIQVALGLQIILSSVDILWHEGIGP